MLTIQSRVLTARLGPTIGIAALDIDTVVLYFMTVGQYGRAAATRGATRSTSTDDAIMINSAPCNRAGGSWRPRHPKVRRESDISGAPSTGCDNRPEHDELAVNREEHTTELPRMRLSHDM